VDTRAKLIARGNGSISLDSNLIFLGENSDILTQGSGDLRLSGDTITLDRSTISSTGSGDLSLSGQSLDMTSSSITKVGAATPGVIANFNLGAFESISLRDNSQINASRWVNFVIDADRITLEDYPTSRIGYRSPAQLSPASRFPIDFSFSCTDSGDCESMRIQPLEPIPEPPVDPPSVPDRPTLPVEIPGSPVEIPGSPVEMPTSPVEPASSPKVVTISLSGRDSSSQNALNLRCQSPIARQVLFQRSGRGGLLATPSSPVTADVFQDFGGQGLGSLTTRSAPPIASGQPTAARTVLEAQNWQVDPQGRISLIASMAVTGDRTSKECPDSLMK
jgi:hypothetical protein